MSKDARSALWLTVSALAVSLLVACNEEASFHVVFDWASEPPALDADTKLFVRAAIKDTDSDASQESLVSVGPYEYTPGLRLPFANVPLGKHRHVEVEIREDNGNASAVAYFGRSEDFELIAGRDAEVRVQLKLTRGPNFQLENWLDVEADARIDERAFVRGTTAKIKLTTDTGVQIRLSNLGANIEKAHPTTLSEAMCDRKVDPCDGPTKTDQLMHCELPWDLDDGVDMCGERDYCDRRVFAQVIDCHNKGSRVLSLPVVVDNKKPDVQQASFQISAPQGNRLASLGLADEGFLTRVAAGAVVDVELTLSEPLLAAPEVFARSTTGDVLPFKLVSSPGATLRYRLEYEPSSVTKDADFFITAIATDRVGNISPALALGDFTTDTSAPVIAEPNDKPTLLFERAPWGDDSSADAHFSVSGAPGSLEPESRVLFYDGPVESGVDAPVILLGHADAASDGSIATTRLEPTSSTRVYALAFDRAGNAAARAAMVRDIAWVAAFGGGASSESTRNPHAFENRSWFRHVLTE